MSPRKGLLSGPKINKKHSTYIDLAGEVILRLKPIEQVRKIILGPIKAARPARDGKQRITLRPDRGQTKIQCRGSHSVQILWVIGADPEHLLPYLKDLV